MLSSTVRRHAACAALVIAASARAAAGTPETAALAAAYNASGLELHRQLAAAPGNIVLSPYSIGSALAMVRTGARGETEREMARTLRHTLPREAADKANTGVMAILNGYDRTTGPGYCPEGAHWSGQRCEAPPAAGDGRCPPFMLRDGAACVGGPLRPSATLVAANALMLPKDAGPVSEAYRATVRDAYGASIEEGAGVAEVNAWVKAKTAGKIDRIIDELPDAAGPVLINAVYLKAAWAQRFSEGATRAAGFHLAARQRVQVPTMHQTADLALAERPGYRAVRIPYSERSLAMVILLPDESAGLDAVSSRLDAGELTTLLGALKAAPQRPVALALPRFKASFAADLVPPLEHLGMRLAFSNDADFSGITGGRGGLRIAAIRHRALIEVNEAGTEAAAATAVAMAKTSLPAKKPEPVAFAVDRPFLFLLVDDASGVVLFQGRIRDPRA